MLRKPTEQEIETRSVNLGPHDGKKTLILDMDETLLHSKFIKLNGEDLDKYDQGIHEDENGVLEFNLLISNKPG